MDTPDFELVEKSRAGDRQAFDVLYQRHRNRVFTLARFMLRSQDEAADVTQEAFLKAWKALPSLRAGDSFGTWVHRIAWNRCQDYLRRPRHGALEEIGDLPESEDSPNRPEARFVAREMQAAVREAIELLSPDHRAVVTMHHIEGLPVMQIADVMGISPGTVMSRLSRARETLRRKLAAYVEPEGSQ